ncbi:MAG TPA: multicopper oxidase family protein [Polyangiaceae bacterium]|nr:multicopper oxidase family protein [Polyangiaceae bacterium]
MLFDLVLPRWAPLLLLAAGCDSPDPAAGVDKPVTEPLGWADEIALPTVQDLNADPHVIEVNIEARVANVEYVAGKPTAVWTYNGGLPGPLLRGKAGDRLIVHFKNSLAEPTSIHWHGLRIPNDMDGVPDMPSPPVAPGQSFDYSFVLPDPGTYWYHPHVASAEQLGNGLFGPLIVDDPNEPAGLGDEAVMVLSDLGIDEKTGALTPPDSGGSFGTLFGREGNLMLVNGKVLPTLHVRPGVRQRWRIINAAKTRYFELQLPGTPFTRIGSDGGFIESPETLDTVLLTPAQRADVIVEPQPTAGNTALSLRWLAYDRGFGTAFNRPPEDLLRLQFDGDPVKADPLPALHREIPAPDASNARAIDISLTEEQTSDGTVVMGINGVPSWDAAPIMTPLGERQVWTVKNTFEFDHPFHLHGFFFQVLDVNGVAPALREWRDTVNVPVDGTVRLLVHFDERPGMWMFHCHILDHADAGMMGMVHLH